MLRVSSRVVLVGAAAGLVLSGCATPGGVDGKLTDDWGALPEAKVFRPSAGACYSGTATDAFKLEPLKVKDASCDGEHVSETVFVGDFPDAGTRPPAANTPAIQKAFGQCDEEAKGYLGDDWRSGRLTMLFVPANTKQWSGGARFFRCDVVEIADEDGKIVQRKGSAKGGLGGDKPLAATCANDTGKDAETVSNIEFVPCAEKHTAEFTGVFTITPANKAFPGRTQMQDELLGGCETLAGPYVGLAKGSLGKELAWLTWGVSEAAWRRGDQGVRCYISVFDRNKPIKGGATIKGLGSGTIPR